MEESNYTPPTESKDYNNDFDILKNQKMLPFENRPYLKMITQINIDEIYNKSYDSFLFANSDVVTIDGVPFLNKFERLKRMKSSYQKVTTNDVKDGLIITEFDFITSELENSKFIYCSYVKQKKQLELWIKKLNEKLVQPIITEPEKIDTSKDLPEIELTTQKEQIRLLYDLGVIEFLQNKYPATLKDNNNQTSKLLSQILKEKHTSIQPTVNHLLNNNAGDKNYPKETIKTKSIIDLLKANEQS